MKLQKLFVLFMCISAWTTCAYAQFSIRAGVNLANETKVFSTEFPTYRNDMLNAFNIGVMYQLLSSKGIGGETGIVFAQKGSNFSYTDNTDASVRGFNETGYMEIPLNIKYVFRIKAFGIYVATGIYGSCAFYGKTILETGTSTKTPIQYPHFLNRLDAGYNVGSGLELFKKIQLGANWSQSFIGQEITENIIQDTPIRHQNFNKVLSVNLAYFF